MSSLIEEFESRSKARLSFVAIALVVANLILFISLLAHVQLRLAPLEEAQVKPDWSSTIAKVLVYRSETDPEKKFAIVHIIDPPVSMPPVIFAGASEVVVNEDEAVVMQFLSGIVEKLPVEVESSP